MRLALVAKYSASVRTSFVRSGQVWVYSAAMVRRRPDEFFDFAFVGAKKERPANFTFGSRTPGMPRMGCTPDL